jgi:hypothetical protein
MSEHEFVVRINNILKEYDVMKEVFSLWMKENKGPFLLDVNTLAHAYIREQAKNDNLPPVSLTKLVMEDIWRKMVYEMCPYQMEISDGINIVESIQEVDDNLNYIYSVSRMLADRKIRLLNISHPSIAVMLRIKDNVK